LMWLVVLSSERKELIKHIKCSDVLVECELGVAIPGTYTIIQTYMVYIVHIQTDKLFKGSGSRTRMLTCL